MMNFHHQLFTWLLLLGLAGGVRLRPPSDERPGQFTCEAAPGESKIYRLQSWEGFISDGEGPIYPDVSCTWNISVPLAARTPQARIRLDIDFVDLLTGEDFVWIYDPAVSKRAPLYRLTGSFAPRNIISQSVYGFQIRFRTSLFGDGKEPGMEQGFAIEYHTVEVPGECALRSPCDRHVICRDTEQGHTCPPCPVGLWGNSSIVNGGEGCQEIEACESEQPDGIRVRFPLHRTPVDELEKFLDAMELLRESGHWNEIMLVHAHRTNFNYAHMTDAFLPWHRWYLYHFETALRSMGPRFRCLTIPYWDWSRDAVLTDPLQAAVFRSSMFGSGSGRRPPTGGSRNRPNCADSPRFGQNNIMGNDCLQRDLGRGGYLPDRQQVMHTLINSTGDFRSFTRLLELSHDAIHRFIGGSMVMGELWSKVKSVDC
jgi:hypothetical protein